MSKHQAIRLFPDILTPFDLGIACLGDPLKAIVPPKCTIDRAEYGRRLAASEGGIFTNRGYIVPVTGSRRTTNAT